QDLGHLALLQREGNYRADIRPRLIGDRALLVVDDDAADGHRDAIAEAIDQLGEHAALVLEVEVERASRDPGFGDDVLDGGLVVAARGEHGARRLPDLLPPLLAVGTRSPCPGPRGRRLVAPCSRSGAASWCAWHSSQVADDPSGVEATADQRSAI